MSSTAKLPPQKIGGLPYLLGLITVPCVALFQNFVFLSVVGKAPSFSLLFPIAVGAALGYFLTPRLIRGPLSVFFHELKHAVVSSLAGNRAKGMRVFTRSGHFKYEYTSKSAHMNAYISLAPYCFPLFGLGAFLISCFLFAHLPVIRAGVVACAFASDVRLAYQDLGPHQSDFFNLRGGYRWGLWYVIFANLFFASLLLLWAYAGWAGLRALGNAYLELLLRVSVGG